MSSKKKEKQISIEEYIGTYCQEKRIRERFAVYISPDTHHNLKRIAQLFKDKHHSTTSSLADSIISHHIETYRELLNNAHEEDTRDFFEWLGRARQSENEESESYQEGV
ncbi:DUF3408 domain-containing protein [Massilibacteroides sp.]|uniref:DUF3408 domain-containing protein n=1 Tax=Massilibacteroides sp. TaxID=2034766 RepID=UPI0026327858|nr:DUF3408 domain-containing protein [Massilibacteroides sp.]MDD4516881.1 DUF3408 domain-containing protein [Massilibacteroides sp.]